MGDVHVPYIEGRRLELLDGMKGRKDGRNEEGKDWMLGRKAGRKRREEM